MSAEILRKAAGLMRERAEAATAAPWERFTTSDAARGLVPAVLSAPVDKAADLDPEVARCLDEPDAEHIASWHPAVAFAVADLLDRVARTAKAVGAEPSPDMIAVATTYLGGAS